MQHVDESTLHAFLDGELSPAEVTELERHLSVCVPCRARLTEARAFVGESDLLIEALDVVSPASRVQAQARPATWRFRPATYAWAATVILAVGLGYSLRPGTRVPAPEIVAGNAKQTPPPQAVATQPAPAPSDAARQDRPAPLGHVAARPRAPAEEGAGQAEPLRAAENTGPPTIAMADQGNAVTPGARVTTAGGAAASAAPALQAQETDKVSSLEGAIAAPRRITMEEAVGHLGGTIRLIDGLAPQRIELIAGSDVPGADPDREVVRIYYEEPDLGLVTLDQQRPGPTFATSDARERQNYSAAPAATVTPAPAAPPALARRIAPPPTRLAWRKDGTWLALTSHRAEVPLAALQARVK